MADGGAQRQGWFSWLQQSIWSPCQHETVDVQRGRGKFFPFLGSPSSAEGTERRPPRGSLAPEARTIRDSNRNGSTAVIDTERDLSTSTAGKEEKQLKGQIPAIWKYLREEEGWSFANPHGWDVQGPPPTARAASGDAESDDSTQQRVGPMSQGQVCKGSILGERHVYLRCTVAVTAKYGDTQDKAVISSPKRRARLGCEPHFVHLGFLTSIRSSLEGVELVES